MSCGGIHQFITGISQGVADGRYLLLDQSLAAGGGPQSVINGTPKFTEGIEANGLGANAAPYGVLFNDDSGIVAQIKTGYTNLTDRFSTAQNTVSVTNVNSANIGFVVFPADGPNVDRYILLGGSQQLRVSLTDIGTADYLDLLNDGLKQHLGTSKAFNIWPMGVDIDDNTQPHAQFHSDTDTMRMRVWEREDLGSFGEFGHYANDHTFITSSQVVKIFPNEDVDASLTIDTNKTTVATAAYVISFDDTLEFSKPNGDVYVRMENSLGVGGFKTRIGDVDTTSNGGRMDVDGGGGTIVKIFHGTVPGNYFEVEDVFAANQTDVSPLVDNTIDLGTALLGWKDVYISGKLTVAGGIDPIYLTYNFEDTQSPPPVGHMKQYYKTDSGFYQQDSAGVETLLFSAVGGGPYLKIDQTVPQTVINGIPWFQDGLRGPLFDDAVTPRKAIETKDRQLYANDATTFVNLDWNTPQEVSLIWDSTGARKAFFDYDDDLIGVPQLTFFVPNAFTATGDEFARVRYSLGGAGGVGAAVLESSSRTVGVIPTDSGGTALRRLSYGYDPANNEYLSSDSTATDVVQELNLVGSTPQSEGIFFGHNGNRLTNTPVYVARITADPNFQPITDNLMDIGTGSHRFRDGYFSRDVIINGKLTVDGGIDPIYLSYTQEDTQSNPPVGQTKQYYKTDGGFYQKTSAGVETLIFGPGGVGAFQTPWLQDINADGNILNRLLEITDLNSDPVLHVANRILYASNGTTPAIDFSDPTGILTTFIAFNATALGNGNGFSFQTGIYGGQAGDPVLELPSTLNPDVVKINDGGGASSVDAHNRTLNRASDSGIVAEWGEDGIITDYDIEITDSTVGIILASPDTTRWRVTIDDLGELTSTLA